MSKPFIVFDGLYGDQSYSPIFEFIHIEPLEARSKMYNWEIEEHVHTDLVQMFIIEEGQGNLISEKVKYQIEGPSVVFIPSNTLHGFDFQDTIKGDVITLANTYVQNDLIHSSKIKSEFKRIAHINFQYLELSFEEILFTKKIIKRELSANNFEKQQYLNLLFQTLFFSVFRHKIQENISPDDSKNKTLTYFRAFQEKISVHNAEPKSVAAYASEIGISTMHLNRICKSVVNKSPIQIIHERLIIEAKKYLLNTSYSISEISYFLKIGDPAYFTRIFKKNVGVSPKEFRKN